MKTTVQLTIAKDVHVTLSKQSNDETTQLVIESGNKAQFFDLSTDDMLNLRKALSNMIY